MATELDVSTSLSLDTATTNLIELGHPALIAITNSQYVDCAAAVQDCSICSSSNNSSSPFVHMPVATVTGKKIWHKASSNLTMVSKGKGIHLVKFEPKISDDYCLSVCYKGEPIKGSPFTIKAVDKGALNGHWISEQSPIVSIGDPVNLVIPDDILGSHSTERGRKLRISVRNSFGVCESSVIHISHLKSISVRFSPDIQSSYFIKVTLAGSAHEKSPSKTFVLQANSPDDHSNHCFICNEDRHIFKKTQNFYNSPVKFHISTQKVVHRDHDKLDIFCQGPSRAVVKIVSDDSSPGLEVCEVTPSIPGKYRMDIFWGGKPIRGNPFYLNFKPPQRRIGSSGLNLEQESFRIGVPHRFRLNCSNIGQGELEISCHPPSAADISIKQLLNDKQELFYQCQVIPRQIGQYELGFKYNGDHIEESPCKVHFKPRGDASKCCMVSSSNLHQVGGNMSFQISTSGAGEGKLAAIVEEITKKHTYSRGAFPVDVKHLSPELYEVQFNPGSVSECLLSVTYDGSHISGSPFKMSFCELNECEASGEGLMSAKVGMWNRFIVSCDHAGPGALWVVIESGSRERVDPIITRLTPTLLEVRYRPLVPGNYSITLQWGQVPIPGSPFQVKCYSPLVYLSIIKPPPAEVPLGIPIRFKVHSTGSGFCRHSGLFIDNLSVIAVSYLGKRLKGNAELNKSSGECDCSVVPPLRGMYTINIKWKGDHIRGSPFNINVIAPPLPENVNVHCLKQSVIVGTESRFWIDTSRAGPGLLSISVRGNNPFKVHSSSDPLNPWTVVSQFCPTHTGDYIMDMRWSGEHIPGSPFTLTVMNTEEEGVAVGGANECCCDDENFQEGVTFF